MNKKYILLVALAAMLIPEFAMAADTIFSGSTMSAIITQFFNIPLVKGILMVGTIGGGLYLVLNGFAIVGKGSETDFKKIILGGILTGIGLSYDTMVSKISTQFQ